MEDLLALQLKAMSALAEAEESIESLTILIINCYPDEDRDVIDRALRELTKTCISYGRLKSTHENYLKDGTKI